MKKVMRFLRDKAGSVAIMAALSLPAVVGFAGLGAEATFWYLREREIQSAADAAAYAGGVQLRAGGDLAAIQSAADDAALNSGYNPADGTINTYHPPQTGPFAGNANYVEVQMTETRPLLLTNMFLDNDVTLNARAVAFVTSGQPACILALSPEAPSTIDVGGSVNAILDGCNIVANSIDPQAVDMYGSAYVETPCVISVGGTDITADVTTTDCPAPIENAPPSQDPYADVEEPLFGGCGGNAGGNPNETLYLSPNRYCGGLTLKGETELDPGVYVIDGGKLQVNATASVVGDGITFFITGGAEVTINGGAHLDLTAPTTGDYAGILFFGDRDDPHTTHTFNGDSTTTFNGAIYFPEQSVSMSGNNTAGGGCTQVVAQTVNFTGNFSMGSDCTGTGVNEIQSGQLVQLVE